MKRYVCIVMAVAVIALMLVVLLLRGPATSSQAQAAHIRELEARLNALESAQGVPSVVAYQGYLVDNGGAPINGAQTLHFYIYDQKTEGEQVWIETHNNVPVSDGYFSVMLGEKSADNALIEVFSQPERWIEVRLGAITMPRQKIGAVPYALSVPALGCRVIATATQNIQNNTMLPLRFDTDVHNTGGCWSLDEPTRLIAPTDGYYMAGGTVTFNRDQLTAPGRVAVGIQVTNGEGTRHIQMNEIHTNVDHTACPSVATGMFYMEEGDYVEVWAYQNIVVGSIETMVFDDSSYQHVVNGWLVKVGN